ncbi:Pimeloyl-ACP methyl ester carboxylesterase [Rhizobiales bacterium GAS191]|nr:Pimeloyl-ACP methyl ester carboxylesterase [Rhizobiales bacterium GAS191]
MRAMNVMDRRTILKSAAIAAATGGAAAFGGEAIGAGNAGPGAAPALRAKPFIETADGTRLFYRDWGTGKPVVFTHAWALNSDIWEYQLTYLTEHGLRCVAYDRRGHGRTSDPGRGYDYDTLADDLAAVIEQLDLREVTLVGFSMGAGEVARYLSRHGAGRIARVVLTSPGTPVAAKMADNPDGTDVSVYEGFVAGITKDRPAFFAYNLWMFFGKGATASPMMSQWLLSQFLQASPKATIECMRGFISADFRPDMRAFTVPTLIIQGDADVLAPIDKTGRRTVQAIPGSRLIVYEGGPHGLVVTEKDRFNRDLLAFAQGS